MVDSKAKGARGEDAAKKKLKELTGLNWERVPLSGAMHQRLMMKGDLFIPGVDNVYCVEVKNYQDDHLTSKYLTDKTPQFSIWWAQTIREAGQVNKLPLLIFKFNRSKFFVAFQSENTPKSDFIYLSKDNVYVMLLETWISEYTPKFIQ